MEFRPCIDIHNGQVKQIVGSSIKDSSDEVSENFVSSYDSAYYANMYKDLSLKGGHVIILNDMSSPYYEATVSEAVKALNTYRGGLQVGGGINASNAEKFIKEGASHVIVTSYAFNDGKICYNNIENLRAAVGKEHVVLDMSCRRKGDNYYIVTDRWQKFTDAVLDEDLLIKLSEYCDEFLVHAVDVEGKGNGIDENVLKVIMKSNIPVTYAGGISSLEDIRHIKDVTSGKVNITIGTSLDIFGGTLKLPEVLDCIR